MNEVSQILADVERGGPGALDRPFPLACDDLRRPAGRRQARDEAGRAPRATARVPEASFRPVGGDPDRLRDGRGQCSAEGAEAIRRILVDNARRKGRRKHVGGLRRVDLVDQAAREHDEDPRALDEAPGRLADQHGVAARVVDLGRFDGLGHEEVAADRWITVHLARRKLTCARERLGDALGG